MATRIAYIALVKVDNNGNIVDKGSSSTTIKDVMNSNIEQRILPSADNDNSTNYPTIVDYLNAEEAESRLLVHMDQYVIVTQG